MKWLPGPETRAAVLKHPFVLAGFAVVMLLGLTAAALVVVDSARGGGASGAPAVAVTPLTTSTLGPTAKTASASGVSGTTKQVTTVRTAPGARTPPFGTLNKGEDIVIDGRTTDAKWYRVIFPPNSEQHGWVDATSLVVVGDPTALVIATAEPPVVVELPTLSPSQLTAVAARHAPTAVDTSRAATATPQSGGLPDLVIGTTPTLSQGKLFVTVVNEGKGEAKGDLVVAVFNADRTKLLGGATIPAFTLAPGRSIDIGTGYEITKDITLLLIVDPNGSIAETDDTNNQITVKVATGNPDSTRTLVPFETPATEPPAPETEVTPAP
ncbi:MAG: SH3 domain-containing protein [Chloroflexota bacterium]|nr:SH3 domain-containing protein [Chloroflexota bacterium]